MLNNDLIFEEIYLYSSYSEQLNIDKIFEKLRLNKNYINKNDLKKFLLNIQNLEIDIALEKDKYSFQDLLEFNLNETLIINLELGQKFIYLNNELLNIVNPYKLYNYKEIFSEKLHNNIKTFNKNILLNSVSNNIIHNNTIYVCLANNVIEYNKSKLLDENNIFELYFPYISQLKIDTIAFFNEKYKELKKIMKIY